MHDWFKSNRVFNDNKWILHTLTMKGHWKQKEPFCLRIGWKSPRGKKRKFFGSKSRSVAVSRWHLLRVSLSPVCRNFYLGNKNGAPYLPRIWSFLLHPRVQPIGLISVSCNWVTLQSKIDQLYVKIQIKKEFFVTVIWK